MAGRANSILVISNLFRDKDGAFRSALVMQRKSMAWERFVSKIVGGG